MQAIEAQGRKYDGDKSPVVQGFFHYFPRAIKAIAEVSRFGAEKYKTTFAERNWDLVEDGYNRYTDAGGRHLVDEAIDGLYDTDSQLLHAAHHAWDACARLEKLLAAGTPVRAPASAPEPQNWVEAFIEDLSKRANVGNVVLGRPHQATNDDEAADVVVVLSVEEFDNLIGNDEALPADTYEQFVDSVWSSGGSQDYTDTHTFNSDLAIAGLGLVGEAGEVTEHLKKYLRSTHPLNLEEIKLELGDVMYYWVKLCNMLGFKPENIIHTNRAKLTARNEQKRQAERAQLQSPFDNLYSYPR